MSRPLTSLAILLPAAVIVGCVIGTDGTAEDGALTVALLLSTGGVALAVAHLAAGRRAAVGPLANQLRLAVGLVVGQILLVVAVFVVVMFVSTHDALLISATVAFAGIVAVRAASVVTGGVVSDVGRLRDGLAAVGEGARDIRIDVGGRDELAQVAASANDMIERLDAEEQAREEAERMRRDLVAAVSHDLRTPITSLQLLAEAVEDGVVSGEEMRGAVDQMGTHIRLLRDLVEDLFELSRIEAGDIRWTMEQVRLDELVGETVSAMSAQAAAKGVRVVAEVADGLDPAHGNPEKVQRVLFNLLQNAIRHTPADGAVTVRAEGNGQAIEIEVSDTGEGVPAADRARVFQPFVQSGSRAARTRRDGGAGLGLAISRAIVEAHGGRIWFAESQVGARVRFSLPTAV